MVVTRTNSEDQARPIGATHGAFLAIDGSKCPSRADGEFRATLCYLAADVEAIASRMSLKKGQQLSAIARLIRSLAE